MPISTSLRLQCRAACPLWVEDGLLAADCRSRALSLSHCDRTLFRNKPMHFGTTSHTWNVAKNSRPNAPTDKRRRFPRDYCPNFDKRSEFRRFGVSLKPIEKLRIYRDRLRHLHNRFYSWLTNSLTFVTPPKFAATKERTRIPNKSNRRLAPAVAPLIANTKVPRRSNTSCSDIP